MSNYDSYNLKQCQRLWYPQKIKQQLAQKLLSAAENPKNPKGADLAFEVSKCFAIAFGFSKDIQSMESWLSIAANRGHKFAKALATKLKISGLQVTQDEELRSPNAPNATPFGIVQPHQPRNHRDDFETEDSSLFAAAVVGDIQEVGAFLKEVGHDMTAEQFFGAVEYATMSLHATVCDIILRRAFQSFPVLPNSPFGSIVKGSLYLWMLFHGKRWVEALGSVIRVLLSHGFDINDYDEGGMTAMGYAVMLHEPVVASTLRAYGASLEQKSKNGYTVLHYAIGGVSNSENIGCVRWLLDYDDPLVPFTHEQRGQLKWSGGPLHIASMHNAHGAAKAILEYTNVDVNGRSSDGDTPLHVACSRNALEMVQLLLHHGADATAVDNGKSTPLEKAVHGISIEVVEYLLSRDVPIYNTRSTPPRSILAYYAGLREPGRTRLSQLLLRYTQSRSPEILHRKNATGRQVLGTAVVAKNDDFVLDLINAGAEIGSPHEPDSEWRSLISNHSRIDYYSAGDSRQVRQYLRTLQAFVDIFKQQDTLEACNSDGKTLLFTAALCGNVAAVTVLLDAGLSARSTDSQGSTILHDALLGAFYLSPADLLDRPVEWFGEKEPAKDRALVDILHLLLNAGADPNAETSGGVRPLHIAVMVAWRLKSTALVELLCERGAHSDAPALGWYGVRPLHIALEAPTFVKAWGVDPSWPSMRVLSDKEANARDTQDVEMVRALVRVLSGAGASFKTFRGWGVHATTEAVRKCNPIGLRAMLAEGVEVYKALETGQAACHYAAQWVEAAGRQRDQTQEPRLIQSSSAWLKARLAAGMENVEVLHEYPDILM
jgi:ankyrin repeat protein